MQSQLFIELSAVERRKPLNSPLLATTGGKDMQISARNSLKGKVKKVAPGSVNTEVTVELAGGTELVSIITKVSAERLGLAEGKQVQVIIKASDVMVATD